MESKTISHGRGSGRNACLSSVLADELATRLPSSSVTALRYGTCATARCRRRRLDGISVICLHIGWMLPEPKGEISCWMWLSLRVCAQIVSPVPDPLGFGI
jgi:hypothetical protein